VEAAGGKLQREIGEGAGGRDDSIVIAVDGERCNVSSRLAWPFTLFAEPAKCDGRRSEADIAGDSCVSVLT
jgi:hypothetical protein